MFSKRMKNLVPYIPGEQPQDQKYIKLNTNENPYPPTPRIDKFLQTFNTEKLRLYPDPTFSELRKTIAKKYGVKKDQIFIGNGSDEVLAFSFYAFFDKSRGTLMFPEFTYSFYPVYCDFLDINYQTIPLTSDFNINIKRFLNNTESCGIILPNPNAPTGILLPLKELTTLLNSYSDNRVVIVDEAYIDFGGDSAISLIDKYQNLLIIRTFSKSMSLAGIRIGFAIGDKALINALFIVKDSFNSYPANTLSLEIAKIAISDVKYFNSVIENIIKTREKLSATLKSIGWNVLPSKANFIFAEKPGIAGEKIYLTLKKKGILVRYFNKPGINNFIRITIGTESEINIFIKEIKACF